jgi:hypothetical protein
LNPYPKIIITINIRGGKKRKKKNKEINYINLHLVNDK